MSPNIDPATAHPFVRATVGEVMHEGVLSCPPEASLADVAALMAEHRVHSVVVFDQGSAGEVWGVLTALDLVAAAQTDPAAQSAGSVAASPVVTIDPGARLDRAAQLMAEYRSSHLVVVDPASGRPAGVISDLDLARAISQG
ncbi:MAG: CBS domain-containing protein [Thermoleophilia bacterium]|jgi:CBS domain-containing protein|nr:CBS domain-containing protein [Thermoleophilia bacterium]